VFVLRGLWSLFVAAVVLVGIIFGNLVAQGLLPRVHLERSECSGRPFGVFGCAVLLSQDCILGQLL